MRGRRRAGRILVCGDKVAISLPEEETEGGVVLLHGELYFGEEKKYEDFMELYKKNYIN